MDRKKEIKVEIPINTISPEGTGSSRRSSKAKMMEGLKRKDHMSQTFYVDAYKRVPKYSDSFTKKGHNILENLKSKTRKK